MSLPGASRCVAITGATRGIGRALVARFVEAGHTVVGCGRDAQALADLRVTHGAPHRFDEVDVSDAQAVAAWAEALEAVALLPDLIINNAALMNDPAPLWEVPPEAFDQLLAVNVSGIHHVVVAFVPRLIAAGRGVIVNLSSGWGRSTSPHVGPYCASKYAVEGYSGSLAQDLPDGLACVALSPGVVDTDMLRLCQPDSAARADGAEAWSRRNAAFIAQLGPEHNGRSLSVS